MRKALLLIICISMLDGLFTAKNFNKIRGSIKVYDNNNNLIYESINGLEGYQSPVDLKSLNDYTIEAIIVSEDQRYFKHIGIDPIAIIRAAIDNIKQNKIVSGGSTITQQVARDNFSFPTKNKYLRKIREMNSALYLELFYKKDTILEKYLTNVYFGNNSYGIETASINYFSKPAMQLTVAESAVLVGSIQSPVILNPTNPQKALIRRNEVLGLMKDGGYIDQKEYNEAISFPLGLNILDRQNKFMHFVEYALNEAVTLLNNNSIMDMQGYKIHTTLSTPISELALESARSQVARLTEKNKLTNAAVVVLDTKDSAILTMLGSIDYFNDAINGAVNVAISKRQPGSALKPFTYGQAFYEGLITPEDTIIDEKTTFIDKNGESFVPYNYNGEFNGEVSVRTALASSLNLPAVKVLDMVGVEDVLGALRRAGVTTLDNPDRYDLSVTLGGGEVTLLELTNAYNSLARKGTYMNTYSVKSIVDDRDNIIYVHNIGTKTQIWGDESTDISNILYSILSDASAKVLGFGRNNVLTLPFRAASKTGTTTDWHDNWTFGYTSDFSVGVWVGNSDNTAMYAIDGVTGAGPIWREVMIGVQQELGNVQKGTPKDDAKLQQNDENCHYMDCYDEGYHGEDCYDEGYRGEDCYNEGYHDENHFDESHINENQIDKDVKITNKKLTITNPTYNSKYYINASALEQEKIAFEVSFTEDVFYVEYILDGTRIATSSAKDTNFKYLYSPQKGLHDLTAKFYNDGQSIIAETTTTFIVY